MVEAEVGHFTTSQRPRHSRPATLLTGSRIYTAESPWHRSHGGPIWGTRWLNSEIAPDGRSLTGTGPRGGLCTAVDARTDQPVPKLADRMWPCSPCIVCMYNTAAHTAHAGHGTHGASHRAKSLQGMAAAVSIRSVLSLILAGGDTATALVGSGTVAGRLPARERA